LWLRQAERVRGQSNDGLRRDFLGAAAAAGGFGAGDAAAFALGDEVPALLDLAEDAVALDGLTEAGEQVLGGFAVSKVY
jgi:hypothetical protein